MMSPIFSEVLCQSPLCLPIPKMLSQLRHIPPWDQILTTQKFVCQNSPNSFGRIFCKNNYFSPNIFLLLWNNLHTVNNFLMIWKIQLPTLTLTHFCNQSVCLRGGHGDTQIKKLWCAPVYMIIWLYITTFYKRHLVWNCPWK